LLTERQAWVLDYLRNWGKPCSAVVFFDDGASFIAAYASQFLGKEVEAEIAQRSLYRVLIQLREKRLIASADGPNRGGMFMDRPPSHCNEYHLTSLARSAVWADLI